MTKHIKQKKHFTQAQKAHKAFLSNADKSGYLSAKTTDGLLVEKEKNFLKSILNDKYPLEESIDVVERLSYVYLLHTEYCLNVVKDKDKALESLKKSYGYHILITYLMVACEKLFTSKKNTTQESLAFGLSMHKLYSGVLKEDLRLFLLSRLETPSNTEAPFVFTATLLAAEKIADIETDILLAYPYGTTITLGNENNVKVIDHVVYLLCEAHIELSREGEFFAHPITKLFPYEVLLWLKLREKSGLQNPHRYSHPMMRMPLVKLFTDMKKPINKPERLPLAFELLEQIRKKCPEVMIPDWIKSSNKVVVTKNVKKVSQASASGNYQAHLPEGHPDAEKLKADPFAYKYYKKNDAFTYEGLEDFDVTLIEWRLREE